MSAIVTSMKVILCLLLYTVNVKSISLSGPSLVRYRPCGLAVVRFDSLNETTWEGAVNFGIYGKLGKLGNGEDVTIDITFEDAVQISKKSCSNCFLNETENQHRHIFEIKAPWPSTFTFDVMLETTDVPTVKEFTINDDTLCNDAIKASQNVESLSVKDSGDHYGYVCGRRALANAELTAMRGEARAGDWPWHVAVFRRDQDSNANIHKCGGSIISRTAVLTSGSCVEFEGVSIPAERIIVVAGTNIRTDRYMPGRQKFIADEVLVHPSYVDAVDASTANLAVIRVSRFRFTDYVQPVCIWGPVYDKTNLFGFQATVVGFGETENGKESDVLRAAYIMVQNDSTCINYNNAYSGHLNEFTFCAGYGPNSTINPRNGDSGGGLVVPTMQPDNKIRWFLRGVFSTCFFRGNGNLCDPSMYTLYTDVAPHYNWIIHHSGLQFTINNNMIDMVP